MLRLIFVLIACAVAVNAGPFGTAVSQIALPDKAKTRNKQLIALMKTKTGKAITVANHFLKFKFADLKAQTQLSFKIDGKTFTCKRKELIPNPTGFSWVGSQAGTGAGGGCTFTVCGCSLNGGAALVTKNSAERWLFRTVMCTDPSKEVIVRVAKVQPDALRELESGNDLAVITQEILQRIRDAIAAVVNAVNNLLHPPPGTKTFKLLVAYTNDAGKAAQPDANKVVATMTASITDAVARMNLAFSSSGIADVKASLEAVYASTSTFTSTSTTDYLAELRKLDTGKFSDVHTKIKSVKPDITVLIVPPTVTNACGQATILPANAKDAFATVQLNCLEAAANSLAHEIGHNFGCLHNIEQYGGTAQPGNAHGYLSKKPTNQWRTLLAYPTADKPTRILRYSNPSIVYPLTGTESEPTGNTNAQCSAQIGKRISTIVTFRNQW